MTSGLIQYNIIYHWLNTELTGRCITNIFRKEKTKNKKKQGNYKKTKKILRGKSW